MLRFRGRLSFALDECPEWKPVAPAGEVKVSGTRRLAPAVAIEQPSGREERIKAAAAALAIGAGGQLPGRERTARRSEATQLRKQNSAAKRFGLIVGSVLPWRLLDFHCPHEFRPKRADSGVGSKGRI